MRLNVYNYNFVYNKATKIKWLLTIQPTNGWHSNNEHTTRTKRKTEVVNAGNLVTGTNKSKKKKKGRKKQL